MTVRHRVLVALMFGIAGVGIAHADTPDTPWQDARQLVLVTTPDWQANQGTLRTFERRAEGWHEVHAGAPVTIGKNGAGWGLGLN
ncbi:MAG: hypothetical protein ACTS5I_06875, partial [Rhodanobacter sp.]